MLNNALSLMVNKLFINNNSNSLNVFHMNIINMLRLYIIIKYNNI